MIDGPRGLMPEELGKLMEDVVSIVYSPRMLGHFPTLFCEENADHLRVIKTDGKIVSHIGIVVRDMIINGCRISVGNVGAVSTREDYRKRGFAWSIFEDAMDKFRANGVDAFLISGYRNLYRLHGATHVGNVKRYRLAPKMATPNTKTESRPFKMDDTPAWASLYRSEPVRFHRPYNDFETLLERSQEHGGGIRHSIWLGNRIIAYAVLGHRKSADSDFIYLEEYAGSRQALLEAFPTWFGEFETEFAHIGIPEHDIEFADLLDSAGELAGYGCTGGTIVILDFPRLCQRMMPMFEEIVGRETAQKLTFQEKDGSCIITLGDDSIVFDDAHDVARLVFGNPPDRDEKTEIPAQGKLGEVLKSIFPIPRPEYGLSYI